MNGHRTDTFKIASDVPGPIHTKYTRPKPQPYSYMMRKFGHNSFECVPVNFDLGLLSSVKCAGKALVLGLGLPRRTQHSAGKVYAQKSLCDALITTAHQKIPRSPMFGRNISCLHWSRELVSNPSGIITQYIART